MGLIKITLIVLGIIVLLVLGSVVYFYNFYVFKTVRGCVSATDITDSKSPCNSSSECQTMFMEISGLKAKLDSAPEFMKSKINEMAGEAIYCEETCKIKRFYGDLAGTPVTQCNSGDKEVLLEIKGKQGIAILKYLKEQNLG